MVERLREITRVIGQGRERIPRAVGFTIHELVELGEGLKLVGVGILLDNPAVTVTRAIVAIHGIVSRFFDGQISVQNLWRIAYRPREQVAR